jgi:hypothetical protein
MRQAEVGPYVRRAISGIRSGEPFSRALRNSHMNGAAVEGRIDFIDT